MSGVSLVKPARWVWAPHAVGSKWVPFMPSLVALLPMWGVTESALKASPARDASEVGWFRNPGGTVQLKSGAEEKPVQKISEVGPVVHFGSLGASDNREIQLSERCIATDGVLSPNDEVSFVVVVRWLETDASPTNEFVFNWGDSQAGSYGLYRIGADNDIRIQIRETDTTSRTVTGPSITDTNWHTIIGRASTSRPIQGGANKIGMWVDGVKYSESVALNSIITGSGSFFVAGHPTTSAPGDCEIAMMAFFDRAFDDAEADLFTADPFGILRPSGRLAPQVDPVTYSWGRG